MKLENIIKKLKLISIGNINCEVTGIAVSDRAKETDIAIVKNASQFLTTKANVLLTRPRIINTNKTLILCLQLDAVAIQIASLMIKEGIYFDYEKSVHYQMYDDMVFMGENVKFGIDTSINPFTCIGNHVEIGKHCRIGSNVVIASGSIIGDGVVIRDGAKIGVRPHAYYNDNGIKGFSGIGKTVIGNMVEIGYNSIIQKGVFSDTSIGENTKIGDLVAIGHDVCIGTDCIIMAQAGVAGDCIIGNHVKLYGQCAINNSVHIGDGAVIYGKTGVMSNISPGATVSGYYGRKHNEEMLLQAKIRRKFRR